MGQMAFKDTKSQGLWGEIDITLKLPFSRLIQEFLTKMFSGHLWSTTGIPSCVLRIDVY